MLRMVPYASCVFKDRREWCVVCWQASNTTVRSIDVPARWDSHAAFASYTVTDLVNDVTYCLQVAAVNVAGESLFTDYHACVCRRFVVFHV